MVPNMLFFWSLKYSGLFLYIALLCTETNRTQTILEGLLLHHDIQDFLTKFFDYQYQISFQNRGK